MANDYAAMQARIADGVDDTDLTSQIKNAIQDAIKRYRGMRFWFNQVVGSSFAVASAAEYVAPALAVANIAVTEPLDTVDLLVIDDGTGANYREVVPVDNSYINAAQTGTVSGRPRHYALIADSAGTRIRFYPIPDQAYTAKLSGVIRFETLSADGDTNPWVVDAETMIRQAAKWFLAADVTRDAGAMEIATAAEGRAMADLRKETLRRTPAQPMRTEVAALQNRDRRYNIMYDG